MHSSLGWIHKNRGPLLIACGIVATLWLRLSGNLNLYIHPRYFTFSVAASLLGLLVIIIVLHWSNRVSLPSPNRQVAAAALLILLSLFTLIITKPASLSSDLATQRGINSGANTEALDKLANIDVISPFGNSSTTQLTVRDWANLLSQTNDQAFFAGKQAQVTGFITADEDKDVFYVSRFVISCCTVDARPIGVPIYSPGWQEKFKSDQWVEVDGNFDENAGLIVVKPDRISPIEKPKDEYVY